MAAEPGQERHHARRIDEPAAERVRHRDVAGAHRLHEARHAERRFAEEFERVAPAIVLATQDHVDGQQAVERFQEDAFVAHGEVGALDERHAEVAREVGVLEVGLVVGTGRQQHDAGRVGPLRRERSKRVAQRLEPAGEPGHVEVAEDFRQDTRVVTTRFSSA